MLLLLLLLLLFSCLYSDGSFCGPVQTFSVLLLLILLSESRRAWRHNKGEKVACVGRGGKVWDYDER